MSTETPQISIIIPIHNGSKWIDACFNGILSQTALNLLKIEVCVCNDASTDNSLEICEKWREKLEFSGVALRIYNNDSHEPGGVGYAKNKAVEISRGPYLCFQDIDDVMLPQRVLQQYNLAVKKPNNVIIGCKFRREPQNSTKRYTNWANCLDETQLNLQVFTSHGPTVIMPTWFCHREVFQNVGGFVESGRGTPEDLIFFYRHLDLKGSVARVDDILLIYTYHPQATTFSINEKTIWDVRLERLQRQVLDLWKTFTIWNAGKQGRQFYRGLSETNKLKVVEFCDVDPKKIGKKYEPYDAETRKTGRVFEIVHFKQAKTPLVICVKTDLTNGDFEANLKELKLEEGADYILFS